MALAAEAGMPLTHLATAFVLAHPAVTSAIIGPRTPEQLDDLLAGADVRLTTTCSTASTRSCRPAPTSTRPTWRFADPARLVRPRSPPSLTRWRSPRRRSPPVGSLVRMGSNGRSGYGRRGREAASVVDSVAALVDGFDPG